MLPHSYAWKAGLMCSIAIIPTATFLTQLTQAVSAVQHVLASGVRPKDLQLVGDSAGGNLTVQPLSHILHPLNGVPLVSLPSPIRGVYLMSPWLSLSGATRSHAVNDKTDVVSAKTFAYCGRKAPADVPELSQCYLEASRSPEGWFKGVEGVVDRVLVTAGARECLKDDIELFYRSLSTYHSGMEFTVQKDGVHNDPYYNFLVGEKKLSDLTPLIINWLLEGFA
jgi:acetyl esterase/lipase